MPRHCTGSLNLSKSWKKTKRKMNPKWTHSEIIKSDLFTCLVLVFLCSATTFFRILAKWLYSIFMFPFNERGRYLKLAGHEEPWLSSPWKAAPRICVRRDARHMVGIHIFSSRSDFYRWHPSRRGWFGRFQGVKWTMAGNLNARGEMQMVTCPLFWVTYLWVFSRAVILRLWLRDH